jgi:hypothetical protein
MEQNNRRLSCLHYSFHITVCKSKVVPVLLTEHHAIKAQWDSGGIAPCILDVGTRCRWMVSFTPRSLYPHGKSPWYPLDMRLVGPRAGLDAVVKKIPSPCWELNSPIVQPVVIEVTVVTSLMVIMTSLI